MKILSDKLFKTEVAIEDAQMRAQLAPLVGRWMDVAKGEDMYLTLHDLFVIHEWRVLFVKMVGEYLERVPGASPVHAPSAHPVHAPSAPSAPPAVVDAARQADKAGVSANAGYRTLAEWGRENGIRKGSDFWRAVVKERATQ